MLLSQDFSIIDTYVVWFPMAAHKKGVMHCLEETKTANFFFTNIKDDKYLSRRSLFKYKWLEPYIDNKYSWI